MKQFDIQYFKSLFDFKKPNSAKYKIFKKNLDL
jgi:hypothetical protein